MAAEPNLPIDETPVLPWRNAFRYLEPTFCSGLLDDPVLLLRVRPLGRNLLFDCGQIHHLAKRTLKGVDAIFVSHAHMDHFMGVDTFIRNVHVCPRTFTLFGPPGLAGKLAGKLAAYDWNLTEPTWCRFRVEEIHERRIDSYLLPGPEGFSCRSEGNRAREDRVIYRSPYLTVTAELVDHKIPILAFRVDERPSFQVDEGKLEAAGLSRGAWLEELNRRFYRGELEDRRIEVLRRRGETIVPETELDAGDLYRRIRGGREPASLGYVTDLGFTPENRRRLRTLLKGVSLLVCECSFLAEDKEKARASHHLCTEDLAQLARELQPAALLPMHLSKLYAGTTDRLYEEIALPEGVTLLRIPPHVPPRPMLPREMPRPLPVARTPSNPTETPS